MKLTFIDISAGHVAYRAGWYSLGHYARSGFPWNPENQNYKGLLGQNRNGGTFLKKPDGMAQRWSLKHGSTWMSIYDMYSNDHNYVSLSGFFVGAEHFDNYEAQTNPAVIHKSLTLPASYWTGDLWSNYRGHQSSGRQASVWPIEYGENLKDIYSAGDGAGPVYFFHTSNLYRSPYDMAPLKLDFSKVKILKDCWIASLGKC